MFLGILAGPIIYLGCSKLGIIVFLKSSNITLLCISALWAILLPLYVYIADYLIENSYEKN